MQAQRYKLGHIKNSLKILNLALLSILFFFPQVIGLNEILEAHITIAGANGGVHVKYFSKSSLAIAQGVQFKGDEVLSRYFALIVENPEDEAAWIALQRLGKDKGFVVWRFNIPLAATVDITGNKLTINRDLFEVPSNEEVAATWTIFGLAKVNWIRTEYFKRYPNAKEYKPSFEEEYFAFEHLLKFWAEVKQENPGLSNNKFDILTRIYKDDLLDAYIYLQHYRKEFKVSYQEWKQKKPEKVVKYFNKYVLIPKTDVPDYVTTDEFYQRDTLKDKLRIADEKSIPGVDGSSSSKPEISPERLAQLRKSNEEQFEILKKLDSIKEKTRDQLLAQAKAYNIIGVNFRQLGEYQSSFDYHNKALPLYQSFKEPEGVCVSHNLIGNTHWAKEDYRKAIQSKEQAVTWCKQFKGDQTLYISILLDLGELHSRVEEFPEAINYDTQGYFLAKESNNPKMLDEAISGFGLVYSNVFRSISWDLKTGLAREGKAADFVNNADVGQNAEKYGRKSPDEDSATFKSLAVWQNFRIGDLEPGRLTEHVRKEMREGNFAPAAKYLYAKYIDPFYCGSACFNSVGIVMETEKGDKTLPQFSISIFNEIKRGNIEPFLDYLKKSGAYTDEQISSLKKDYSPVENDITFEEVNSNLKTMRSSGRYIPDHILKAIALFEAADKFSKAQNISIKK